MYLKPEKIIELGAGEKIFAEDFFGFDAGVIWEATNPMVNVTTSSNYEGL